MMMQKKKTKKKRKTILRASLLVKRIERLSARTVSIWEEISAKVFPLVVNLTMVYFRWFPFLGGTIPHSVTHMCSTCKTRDEHDTTVTYSTIEAHFRKLKNSLSLFLIIKVLTMCETCTTRFLRTFVRSFVVNVTKRQTLSSVSIKRRSRLEPVFPLANSQAPRWTFLKFLLQSTLEKDDAVGLTTK